MKKLGFLGLISLILGMILLVNSFPGITGFAISENIPERSYSIFGIVFILGGIMLIFLESKKSNLERKIEREKIWKPHATKEKILEIFQEQRELIEKKLGIKLTNIEAWGLRKITEKYMKEMVRNEISGISFRTKTVPAEEIPARFLYEFYGISNYQYDRLPKNEDQQDFTEGVKEWFRIRQKKLHHEY